MPQHSDAHPVSLETAHPPTSSNQKRNSGRRKPRESLKQKLSQRTARVGVLGLGYVGLSTMVACAEAGFRVTGLEINRERVDRVNSGHSYIEDVEDVVLGPLVQRQMVTATDDFGELSEVDVIVICVPTPVNKAKDPELVRHRVRQ